MSDNITIVRAFTAALVNVKLQQPTRYPEIPMPDLLDELRIAKNKGPEMFIRLRKQYAKYRVLIIDERLLFPISKEDSEMLFSLLDSRQNVRPTIVVSHLEPAEWLDQIPVPFAVESIMDRLSAKAYKIMVQGIKV